MSCPIHDDAAICGCQPPTEPSPVEVIADELERAGFRVYALGGDVVDVRSLLLGYQVGREWPIIGDPLRVLVRRWIAHHRELERCRASSGS